MTRELVTARIAELLGTKSGIQRIDIAFQQILEEGGKLEDTRKGEQIVFLLSRATSREDYRLTLETLLNLHSNLCRDPNFVRSINEILRAIRMHWNYSESRLIFIGRDSVPIIECDYIEEGLLSAEYKELVDEINELARSGLLASCAVMKRKLVENLMIDLLRNKYPADRSLFLTNRGDQYKMYFQLIESIRGKKEDFRTAYPDIDRFISLLEEYREPGNTGAHNIILNPTTAQVVGERDQFTNLLRIFRRLFG